MATHIHIHFKDSPKKEELKKRLDAAKKEEKRLDETAEKVGEEIHALSSKYGGRANVPADLLSKAVAAYKEAMSAAKRAGVAREKIEEEYKKTPEKIW